MHKELKEILKVAKKFGVKKLRASDGNVSYDIEMSDIIELDIPKEPQKPEEIEKQEILDAMWSSGQ